MYPTEYYWPVLPIDWLIAIDYGMEIQSQTRLIAGDSNNLAWMHGFLMLLPFILAL